MSLALLKTYLSEAPNVEFYGVSALHLSGQRLVEILDKSANYIAERLSEMPSTDPYYNASLSAYEAIPTTVRKGINLVIVTGGPGCGKTQVIRQICANEEGCTVMVPFKRLQRDYSNGERCYTQHVCVARDMTTEILLVDEFTGCDIGLVCATALNQKCSNVVLWGDVMQTWLSDEEGVSFRDYKIPVFAKLRSNFRNPPETVKLLNKLFEDNMVAMRDDGGGITVEELYDNPLCNGVCLTGSRASVEDLEESGLPSITVRSAQGATYDNVGLYIFQRDLNIFTSPAILRVALSRHRTSLTVYTVHTDSFKKLVESGRLVNDHLVGIDAYELSGQKSWFSALKCLLGL